MPIEIASADDPRIADYVGLRNRAERADVFIAESKLVVTRLLTSTFEVRSFLFAPERYEQMSSPGLPERAESDLASS